MQLSHNHILITPLGLKPLIKRATIAKHIWQQKIQQRPKLMQVILQRRSGNKQPISRVKDADDLSEGRLLVLDAMCFVHDDVFPGELLEVGFLAQNHFVGGDHDVEILCEDALVDQFGTLLLGALEHEDINTGRPVLEFALPVIECGFGDGDKMRAGDAGDVAEVS